MTRLFEIVTFDCYGTLIDWESGITGAFASIGCDASRDALLAAYSRVEPVVQSREYRPYREVLKETSRIILESFGTRLPAGREDFLPESLPGWKPFADTNAALSRLKQAGFRLGILSNVDDDLLTATCRHIPIPFDFTITAQQVRSYKPSHAHFLAARASLKDARWLHAAQSWFHDIVPCAALGIPSAWINRRHEDLPPGGAAPALLFPDLATFADHLSA